MNIATKDQWVALCSDVIEQHFPKGETKMRGEALVLIADLTRALFMKDTTGQPRCLCAGYPLKPHSHLVDDGKSHDIRPDVV